MPKRTFSNMIEFRSCLKEEHHRKKKLFNGNCLSAIHMIIYNCALHIFK